MTERIEPIYSPVLFCSILSILFESWEEVIPIQGAAGREAPEERQQIPFPRHPNRTCNRSNCFYGE